MINEVFSLILVVTLSLNNYQILELDIPVLNIPLTDSVILDKFINLSKPWFLLYTLRVIQCNVPSSLGHYQGLGAF